MAPGPRSYHRFTVALNVNKCQQAQLGRLTRLAGCYGCVAANLPPHAHGRAKHKFSQVARDRPAPRAHGSAVSPKVAASGPPPPVPQSVQPARGRPQDAATDPAGGYNGGKLDLPAISLRAKAALRALTSSQAALSSIAGIVFSVVYCSFQLAEAETDNKKSIRADGLFPAFCCYLQETRSPFFVRKWRIIITQLTLVL